MLERKWWTLFLAALFLFPRGVGHAEQPDRIDEALQSFRVYKRMAIADAGPFEFERRSYILETIEELSRTIRTFPDRKIIATVTTSTIADSPMLDLIDIDRDGHADMYVYSREGGGGGSSQHFGFVFDLNEDGRYDHVVFSQGTMIVKPFKIISTFYHNIDSNYDGRIDIWVKPDTDLDHDGTVDEGVFSWLYDRDFDGCIDDGEYLGMGISMPMAGDNEEIELECVMGGRLDVGNAELLGFGTSMLVDINSASGE